jgi:SAM-dependent methyltransferase
MPLPDVSRMLAPGPGGWRELAQRLAAIGLDAGAVHPFAAIGERLIDPLRAPLRRWHLRRRADALGWAMRLLMFQDPVSAAEAEAALGSGLLAKLRAAGYIVPAAAGLVSPFYLNLVNELLVICDDLTHGEDAVMGAGPMTADLCNASYPLRPLARALDLGCGAGTGALVIAPRVARVVASDINPRALVLAQVNAQLNGVGNIEFRQGNLFAPVAGEEFDLIMSQPPFIAMPAGATADTYLYGGARGDELPLRVLAGLRAHLAPGGRAVMQVEWPEVDGDPVMARVRAALAADDLDALLLESPSRDLDRYCAAYAAAQFPQLGAPFEQGAMARRDHLAAQRIVGLRLTLTVVERASGRHGWSAVLPMRSLQDTMVTSRRIDRLLAARALALAGREALLAARLRLPEGTVFVAVHDPTDAGADAITARLGPRALTEDLHLDRGSAELLEAIHQSPDARAACARVASEHGLDQEEAIARILPAIVQALECGLLEAAG